MRRVLTRTYGMLASVSATLLAVVGCSDGPTLVPVAGVVTLDGKPLEGATLSFVPLPGNPVSTAGTDATGPSGNFKMTYNGRAGLAPGKYSVAVSKTEDATPAGKQISPIFAKASFEKQLMGLTKETIPPQKLAREVVVPEGGATDFDLDFKSKGAEKEKKSR
jgi:hypothetical protein